jgi:hypothetical protein
MVPAFSLRESLEAWLTAKGWRFRLFSQEFHSLAVTAQPPREGAREGASVFLEFSWKLKNGALAPLRSSGSRTKVSSKKGRFKETAMLKKAGLKRVHTGERVVTSNGKVCRVYEWLP